MTTSAGIAHTKADPVQDYLTTFDQLRARKRWTEQTVTCHFVALILGAVGLDVDFSGPQAMASAVRRTKLRALPPPQTLAPGVPEA